jgi:hypothetical protein
LSTTGNLFEKAILKIVQRHIKERGLLNASQFDFCVHHCMILKCMRLTNHVTLNFRHLGLVYKLSESKFFISVIKLINTSFSEKFRASVESQMSMPRYIQAGMP